jgi:hypothetical protein
MCTAPGLDFHHDQHIQASQRDGIDMQEVTRQDAGRLRDKELPPRRRRPPWRGTEPGGGQDPADRARSHAVSQAEEFALDAQVSPA